MFAESQSNSKIRQPRRHHNLKELLSIDFDRHLEKEQQARGNQKLIQIPPPCASLISNRMAADDARDHEFKEREIFPEPQATFPVPPFLGLAEAADWLNVSLSTIKRIINRDELTTLRVGARQKIPLAELRRYALAALAGYNTCRSKIPNIIMGL